MSEIPVLKRLVVEQALGVMCKQGYFKIITDIVKALSGRHGECFSSLRLQVIRLTLATHI
jgi:hypothetical protein